MTRRDTLISKYLSADTTVREEMELAELLRSIPESELDAKEKAILLMLEVPAVEENISIFEEDNLAEYNRIVAMRRPTMFKRTLWIASAVAACIALVVLFRPGRHQPVEPGGMVVEAIPVQETADTPAPADTMPEPSLPAPSAKKPAHKQAGSVVPKNVVQAPAVKPELVAVSPVSEPSAEAVREVEEELARVMMRERLNAEIEERMKNQSQTPDAYIL